jgi:hypothetical protein
LNIDFTDSPFFIKSFPFSILQIDKVKSNCHFYPALGRKHGKLQQHFSPIFSSLVETFIDFSQITLSRPSAKNGFELSEGFFLTECDEISFGRKFFPSHVSLGIFSDVGKESMLLEVKT